MRQFLMAAAASLLIAAGTAAQSTDECLPIRRQPPAGKALVNLHHVFGPPWISVWHEELYLTDLFAGNVIQVEVDPGEHLFVASMSEGGRIGAIFADVEAGRIYDADIQVVFKVKLKPATRGSKLWKNVPERIEHECGVGMRFPGMPEMSVAIDPPIDEVVRRFRAGEWKGRVSRLNLEDGRPGDGPSEPERP